MLYLQKTSATWTGNGEKNVSLVFEGKAQENDGNQPPTGKPLNNEDGLKIEKKKINNAQHNLRCEESENWKGKKKLFDSIPPDSPQGHGPTSPLNHEKSFCPAFAMVAGVRHSLTHVHCHG